jgi:hypothetical protein
MSYDELTGRNTSKSKEQLYPVIGIKNCTLEDGF